MYALDSSNTNCRSLPLAGLIGVAVVLVLTIDLGRFKGSFEQIVRDATGREFSIAGDFQPSIGATVDLVAEDVRLANADWGTAENILELERIVVSIDTWSLFSSPIDVLELEVEGLTLHFEEDPETLRSSWSFEDTVDEDDAPFELPLWLRRASLSRVDITYGQGWLDRPRTISISSALVSEQSGELLSLDLTGTTGNDPMRAEGLVGPLPALLDGRNPRWELQVTIGEFLASTEGTFADLFALEGPQIHAAMKGPLAEDVLSRLGLPPLARGPIDVSGELSGNDDGIGLRVEGAFGDLETNLIGSAKSLTSLGELDLSVDIQGPDLQAIGKLFDAGFLPSTGFAVNGSLGITGDTILVESVLLSAGNARLEIDGKLAPESVDPDARMRLSASGPEILDFLPPILADGIPSASFDIFATGGGGLQQPQLDQLRLVLGEEILTVELSDASIEPLKLFEEPLQLDGLQSGVSISGADLQSLLEPWSEVFVPAVPFTIDGKLHGIGDALELTNITYQLGPTRGTLDGSTGSLPSLEGLSLQTSLASPDANQFVSEFATAETDIQLPSTPFETSALLSKSGGAWSASPWVLQIGESRLEMSGSLGHVDAETGIDIDFAASGPDLRPFIANRDIDSPLPFTIEGGMEIGATAVELQAVDVRIGETTAWLNGRLPTAMEIMNAEFDLRIAGPNLQLIGRAFDIQDLPADAYRFEGALKRSGQQYIVDNLTAVIGDNDLRGDISLEMGARPRLTAQLESQRLNLTDLFADDEEDSAEDAPRPERLIPDTPLPLHLLDFADLDVTFHSQDFDSGIAQVGDVELRMVAANDELHIDMSRVSLTYGGTVSASLDLVRTADDQADVSVSTKAEQFLLWPPVDGDGEPLDRPPKDLELELSGSGGTLRELTTSANGYIDLRLGRGEFDDQISGFLLRDFLRQLLSAINPKRDKSQRTMLTCGFLELDIVDGLATSRAAGFQTDKLSVAGIGTVALATEEVDVTIRVKQREGVGVSVAGVVNPYIKVGGTLADPALKFNAKRGLVSGTLAVLSGGLSILAKGAWDRYLSRDDYCEAVLEALDAGEIPDWREASDDS